MRGGARQPRLSPGPVEASQDRRPQRSQPVQDVSRREPCFACGFDPHRGGRAARTGAVARRGRTSLPCRVLGFGLALGPALPLRGGDPLPRLRAEGALLRRVRLGCGGAFGTAAPRAGGGGCLDAREKRADLPQPAELGVQALQNAGNCHRHQHIGKRRHPRTLAYQVSARYHIVYIRLHLGA